MRDDTSADLLGPEELSGRDGSAKVMGQIEISQMKREGPGKGNSPKVREGDTSQNWMQCRSVREGSGDASRSQSRKSLVSR